MTASSNASLTTDELMQIALDLADLHSVPDDSAVYVPGDGIERVMFGIDVGVGELMLGRQLGYDAVVAHHPVGLPHRSWAVFDRHIDLLVSAGVPRTAATQAVEPKREALRVRGQAGNYERVPMAARRLSMPFVGIHTPLDELGRRVMQDAVDSALKTDLGATLEDVAQALAQLPAARRSETDVMVLLGEPAARAGRVVVAHGALTNGGYDVARAYFDHGVDTVIYIHISPEDLRRLRADEGGQLIVIGHLVGDATGIEPYIGALRGRGLEVDVLSQICSAGPE